MGPESGTAALFLLSRVALALGLGLLVGVERLRAGKEAGLRTFALTSLAGSLAGLVSPSAELAVLAMVAVVVLLANAPEVINGQPAQVTTAVALFVTALLGMLVGRGYVLVPVACAILMTELLSWRQELARFATGLTDSEWRSALSLGILAFVVYPALPEGFVDPWGVVNAREVWVTVILIAAIGFANYVLLRRYGTRGISLTGLLGGLVNSTATVAELAQRARVAAGKLDRAIVQAVALANAAMLFRNGLLLVILAPQVAHAVALPPAIGVVASLGLAFAWRPAEEGEAKQIELASPFSIVQVLRFGLVFLVVTVASALGQRELGSIAFYAVTFLGGLVSSASATATVASLAAQGKLTLTEATIGALLASAASLAVHPVLIWRLSGLTELTRRAWVATGAATAAGLIGFAIDQLLW